MENRYIIAQYHCFAEFSQHPSPMGWSRDPWRFSFSKMAAAEPCEITFEEIELLSFLRQNIIHHICEEAERQGLSKRDVRVVQAVVAYFNQGPAPHHIFNHFVWHLAHTIWRWVVHVTPHSVAPSPHHLKVSGPCHSTNHLQASKG